VPIRKIGWGKGKKGEGGEGVFYQHLNEGGKGGGEMERENLPKKKG